MEINYDMSLEQSQKFILTPEMKQSIEILQCSSLELSQLIQEELMTNPTLEIQNENQDFNNEENDLTGETSVEKIDWKEYFAQDDYGYNYEYRNITDEDEKAKDFYNFVSSNSTNLHEHLLFQLEILELDKTEREAGRYIIENIDDNGYLNISNQEVMDKFDLSQEIIEKIITKIQAFDPLGVGAKNVQECLLIQLRNNKGGNKIAIEIIKNYLVELAENKVKYIAHQLNVSLKDVQAAIDTIKTLDPKPGKAFSMVRDIKYLNADITVLKRDEDYVIIVNDTTAPRLIISKYYKTLMTEGKIDENTASYISKKLESAMMLIKNIEKRRNTIYKVVGKIVEKQADFLEKGKIYLKPMTLKTIADELGINESTVSRAINDKIIETPRGIFPLKYFFQSGTTKVSGEGISAGSLKLMIKEMIAEEDPLNPLSDQYISDVLTEKGVNISRRTVAKYRSQLAIPSSAKRKRYE